MAKSLRSVCIDLAENSDAITAWRNALPERQRRRLVHPLSVTPRWRASTAHSRPMPQDLRRDAKAAWQRFCVLTSALPACRMASSTGASGPRASRCDALATPGSLGDVEGDAPGLGAGERRPTGKELTASLDHLVGGHKHCGRHGETKSLRRLEIDD
jgi:hypothetical protein